MDTGSAENEANAQIENTNLSEIYKNILANANGYETQLIIAAKMGDLNEVKRLLEG